MTPVWLPQDVAEAYLLPRIQSLGVGEMLAMGVIDRDNNLVGCAAIHDWNPDCGTCEVSAAADTPRWINRSVLNFFFGHIFGTMNLQMCYGKSSSDNPRARRIWQLLGAAEIIIPRGRGRDVDEHVMLLTDDRWKLFKTERLAG